MLKIYGIKNCDTVKKALKWLEANGIEFEFYDYKKQGVDEDVLTGLVGKFGWDKILNLKSSTWRMLDDKERPVNANQAIELAKQQSSIIKRPIIDNGKDIQIIGFKEEEYKSLLNN